MSSTNNQHIARFVSELKTGSLLTKRKPNGDQYSRHFFLDEYEHFISYHQSEKVFAQPNRYYIHKINEIRPGLQTRTFDRLFRHKIVEQEDEKRAFSLFYNNYRDELHLMANDGQTRDAWIQALQHLIHTHTQRRQRHVITETNWILNYFYLADKDGSGTLTKNECRRLLIDSLNAKVSKNAFETLFNAADTSGEGVLTPDEFVNLFYALTRRKDLYAIMQQYVKNGHKQSMDTIRMNIDELLYFLRNIQNQTIIKYQSDECTSDYSLVSVTEREQVQELINEFETDVELQEKGQLSLNGFRNLLLSDEFSVMKPWCSRHIYQDMTRPLSDYYINTSHNTYLFNNQISGTSNPEAYNRVLCSGCRAVEIDCYDGANGRPIVKHGYTLVQPCLFESIIRFIEPNLFKISPYPVILDLENHCSIEQQHEMARILKQVFGDRLITEPLSTNDSSVLPSPEDLKYKVLVRVIEHDLAGLFIYFQNIPFLPNENDKDNYSCCHSPNLSEKHFDRILENDPLDLIKQTGKSVFRMYPHGLRQDSSNPDPINAWNFGIHMVALNFQHDDLMMSLSYGKFIDNGGCGYILKPKYLINAYKINFNPFDYLKKPLMLPDNIIEHPQRLTITIISGQFLSRSNETTQDIPDPYVVVSTHGILCDQQTQKTKFIENNGFDPLWNETFQFNICFPQMCLVRFDVYDYDVFTKDDRIAYFCLPMTTMQTGYRHVHLRTKHNNLTYSTLFIHVTIENN
ncbi:unnamed protein product [Rotaria sordida]|uniref:Phosphoinositide phospholipase C n=1 Tax=Rotaria sordida TaxID=392033 RepID=A0A814D5B7_9BILA|nr:unnamed protein product [Rotaria sordida]